MADYLAIARAMAHERQKQGCLQAEPSETILKGKAIELWSDAFGGRCPEAISDCARTCDARRARTGGSDAGADRRNTR